MKLIIDIDKEDYERLHWTTIGKTAVDHSEKLRKYILNGTPVSTDGDVISRSVLKKEVKNAIEYTTSDFDKGYNIGLEKALNCIDNAPTVEEKENSFITECRNTAIKENLPLYFVYYEEIGVLEVYVTETKELFEKRHCAKHLPNYKFKEAVMSYLDWYSGWKGGAE